jgi:hypothetical protein
MAEMLLAGDHDVVPSDRSAPSLPPSPPAPRRDHLDPAIRPIFLPGVKHGICHRLTSNDQLMPGCIAGDSRDS